MTTKKVNPRSIVSGVASLFSASFRFVEFLICRIALLTAALVCTFILAMLGTVIWHIGVAASMDGLSFFLAPGAVELDMATATSNSAIATVTLVSFCVVSGVIYRLYLRSCGHLPTPEVARSYAMTGTAPKRPTTY